MAQTGFPLPPAGAAGTKLMSIDPQKNWRRYPSVPITKAMVTPAYVPVISYTGGAADEGANSDNNGETGTANVTNDWNPKTQAAKAAQGNLTPGTVIAPDVGKSYGAKARGAIYPTQPYPQSKPIVSTTPAAFLPANYVAPTAPAS